ncbi:hypothetical protein Hte_001120 [Hypoxylon texense]
MAFVLGFTVLLLSSEVLAVGHVFPNCASGFLASNDICNTSLTIGQRAKALVAALETDEKYGLLVSTSPGVERAGLPSYEWWSEALHGVASSPGVQFAGAGDFSYATSFPQPILMGASFDDDLIEAVATVVSTEARAFNNFNRSGLDYWVRIYEHLPVLPPLPLPTWVIKKKKKEKKEKEKEKKEEKKNEERKKKGKKKGNPLH